MINLPFVQSKPLWIQGYWKNKKGVIKKWYCIEPIYFFIWFEEKHCNYHLCVRSPLSGDTKVNNSVPILKQLST